MPKAVSLSSFEAALTSLRDRLNNRVRVDAEQPLSPSEMARARSNIGAKPGDWLPTVDDLQDAGEAGRAVAKAADAAAARDAIGALSVEFGGTLLRQYTSVDVAKDMGADLAGGRSATDAFNEAYTAANASSLGIKIILPPGLIYLPTMPTVPITKGNTFLVGAGVGTTQVHVEGGGALVQYGTEATAASGGGVSDMSFWSINPAPNSVLFNVLNGSVQNFERLSFSKIRGIATIGRAAADGVTALWCGGVTFRHLRGNTHTAAGNIAIDAINGTGLVINDAMVSVAGVGFPTDNTSLHPGDDTTFIRMGKGTWDTFTFHEVVSNRYGRGLDINVTPGNHVGNGYIAQSYFDYSKFNGMRFKTVTGSQIRAIAINTTWAVANDGHSIEMDNGGVVRDLQFSQVVGRQAGKNNWKFWGAGDTAGVTLTDCRGLGANRLSPSNTGADQDDLVILCSGVSVRGGWYGQEGSSYTGITGNRGRYGVTIGAEIGSYELTGATIGGEFGPIQLPVSNTTGSKRRLVTGNRPDGNAVIGYAAATAVTAPASAQAQTHTGATLDTLYIYGGTVSSITHNGTQVATGQATLALSPGDTWSVTYTAAPTIKRVARL